MGAFAGYPTAYRAGSGYGPMEGFRMPSVPTIRPISPRPSLPKPANTNLPKVFGRPVAGAFGRRTAARTALGGFSRLAGRFIPLLGLALLAYDLYELYKWFNAQAEEWKTQGWTLWDPGCAGGGGSPFQQTATGCVFRQTSTLTPGIRWNGYQWVVGYWGNDDLWLGLPIKFHLGSFYNPQVPQPERLPEWQPATPPIFAPPDPAEVHPSVDPNSLPIGRPVPTVRPIPHRVLPKRRPNPWRSPTERTDFGYSPPGGTSASPGRHPTIEVRPVPGPARQLKPDHKLRPPARGTKERKVAAAHPLLLALNRGVGLVTEGLDTLYCIWNALPKSAKEGWRHAPPQIAARQIYEHFDELDIEKAVRNLIDNEVEDYLIGRVGRYAKQLNREFDLHLQTGSGRRLGEAFDYIRKMGFDTTFKL